jgi:hypothetical protein
MLSFNAVDLNTYTVDQKAPLEFYTNTISLQSPSRDNITYIKRGSIDSLRKHSRDSFKQIEVDLN